MAPSNKTKSKAKLQNGSLFADCFSAMRIVKNSVYSIISTIIGGKQIGCDNEPYDIGQFDLAELKNEQKRLQIKLVEITTAIKLKESPVVSNVPPMQIITCNVIKSPIIGPLRKDFDRLSCRLLSLLTQKPTEKIDMKPIEQQQQECTKKQEPLQAEAISMGPPRLFSARDLAAARGNLSTAVVVSKTQTKGKHSDIADFLAQSMKEKFRNVMSPS